MGTNRNSQYSLFDEPREVDGQNTNGEDISAFRPDRAETTNAPSDTEPINTTDLQALFSIAEKVGIYFPLSGEKIMERARTYYEQKIAEVEKFLNASGLTQETIKAVKRDYLIALAGYYNFQADPDQMQEAYDKLKFNRAFMIDRYGLFHLLLSQYKRVLITIYNHFTTVIEANPTPDAKQKYIETFPPENLRAAAWTMQKGIIKLLDFEGVPAQTVADFADTVQYISDVTDYCNFYHLCKYAYIAPPEELETIRKPKALQRAIEQGFTTIVEDFCTQTEQALSDAAERYADAMEKPDPNIGKWSVDGVKVSANLTAAQQKPIEVHTKYTTDTLPIRQYIESFPLMQGNEKFKGLITEATLQTVIGGLDAIRSWGKFKNITPVNGVLTYPVSMEDFAKICGFKDANQRDKTKLLGGLLMLNNLYIYCDRPIRIRSKSKSKYKIGGWLKVFDLRWISTDGNDLIIDIHETDLGGELRPITPKNFIELRKMTDSVPEARFIEQIKGKTNIKEEALLDQCFGYSDILKYIPEEDTEELRKAKKNIRSHKPRDRQKLQGWFKKYHEQGFIVWYTYNQNKAGEWVYKWEADLIKGKKIKDAQQAAGAIPPPQTNDNENA